MVFTYTDITQQITSKKGVIVSIIKINKQYHIMVTVKDDVDGVQTIELINSLKQEYGGEIHHKGLIEYGFYQYNKAYLLNINNIDEEKMSIELLDHYIIEVGKIKIGA